MVDIEELKNRLEKAQKAQKDNESAAMRAEFAQEQAKTKILAATQRLKELGYTSVTDAEAAIKDLESVVEENLSKAAEMLDISY